MSRKIINLKEKLNSTPEGEKLQLITNTVDLFIRDILDLTDDDIVEHDIALNDIGMDSISAVKLKDMVCKSLEGLLTIESTEIFDNPTIDKFSVFLYSKLQGSTAPVNTQMTGTSQETTPTEINENLGTDEIIKRLQEKLKEEKKDE